jgi:hypothetical protein
MPLLLSCRQVHPPLEIAPLAGSQLDLSRFEGRWFDEEGTLHAVVSSRPQPSGGRRRSESDFYMVGAAVARKDELLVKIRSARYMDPITIAVKLIGPDEAEISQVLSPSMHDAVICRAGLSVPIFNVKRHPSPLIFVKRSARETAELTHRAYVGTMDWLARVL